MKKLFLTSVLLVVACVGASAQVYPYLTIRQIQQVPAESLAVADTLPGFSQSAQPRWTLQASPYVGDTVRTTAIVAVPPGVITYTMGIWTMLLYDTAAVNNQWGGILLRANAADTTLLKQAGFLNVSPGDTITLTGVISEFPALFGFSATQLAPLAGKPIDIGSVPGPLPKPIVKTIGDFYKGIFSTGKVQYSTGEPYEGMYVELHNLTINNKVNNARGTFSVVDASGNEIAEYDWSHYFTKGHGSTIPWPGDTAWTRFYDTQLGNGVRIDTLRGVIGTASGQEGPRGYRISPIYPSDIVFTKIPAPPLVTTHRRNPVVVTPDTTATVSVKITRQANGSTPKTVSLLYGVDNAAFTTIAMTFRASDTTYVGVIPRQSAGAFVRYFVQVVDSFAQVIRLANASLTSSVAADSSKGFFFYTSLNRSLTIQDVQQTPYAHGSSGYVGAVIPLSGVVTADTAHIGLSPWSGGSTNAWYIQSTSQPWSGIWLQHADSTGQSLLAALRNGDSVTVTGTVQEQFDVTRLGNVTAVVKHTSGNAEPAPVVLTTGAFNVGNGVPTAEPYEGMLVRFNNVAVTDTNPTYSDPSEYTVNDGTGGVIVQRSGKNKYSNISTETGKTILRKGNTIGSLTGIMYFSFRQYKFVPRTDADFVNVVLTGVEEGAGFPSGILCAGAELPEPVQSLDRDRIQRAGGRGCQPEDFQSSRAGGAVAGEYRPTRRTIHRPLRCRVALHGSVLLPDAGRTVHTDSQDDPRKIIIHACGSPPVGAPAP
jgi:hypothetical protein